MRFAKLFVVSGTAVLLAGALFTQQTSAIGNARHPQLVTDGGAPLPQPPNVADGGAPLPQPLNPQVADGGAPLPQPPNPQVAFAV